MHISRPLALLVAAAAREGVTLLDEHKAALEAAFDKVAEADANRVADAIAAHLTMHGMAGTMQTPLRNALTGAEPALDQVIDENVASLVETVEGVLKSASAA